VASDIAAEKGTMSTTRRDLIRAGLAGLVLPAALEATEALPETAAASRPSTGPLMDIGRFFRAHDAKGTLVLHSLHDDSVLVHDPARADQPYIPASTFKIPNSLFALETGVIEDENVVLKWDGERRPIEVWNRDHTMRSAIEVSAVWFYQEMARRIGRKRMKAWVNRVGYGNRDIGGDLDSFWLDGKLRITARQQVAFLRRLAKDELPFSERTRKIVKDILVLEKTDAHVLRGKTGLGGSPDEPGVGWIVGWVEAKEKQWVYAMNLEITKPEHIPLRKALLIEILKALGVLV
jgi:beta-lactamase class D